MNFFIHPSKLFDKTLVASIEKDMKPEEKKQSDD